MRVKAISRSEHSQTSAIVESRIQTLRNSDLRQLAGFARARLRYFGLSVDDSDDLVQNAIRAVLLGLETEEEGRRPRPMDVASDADFLRYLKSVICSGVEALWRRESKILRVELVEHTLTHPADFVQDFSQRDFSEQLFKRIYQNAPLSLRALARGWAATWDDSASIQIGNAHRRTRQKLRAIATSVMMQLSE